jgi:electron transfer flavoprotein alpha subunit
MSTKKTVVACSLSMREARSESAQEVLTAARLLAEPLGASLTWLVVGDAGDDLGEIGGRFGAGSVEVLRQRGDTLPGEEALVAALAAAFEQERPQAVVFAQSFIARSVVPRVAARLRSPVLMNVLSAAASAGGAVSATASAFGGDTHARYDLVGDPPHFLSLLPRAVSPLPVAGLARPAQVVERELPAPAEGDRVRVVERPRLLGPRLEDATIVVSGGRGLGDPSRYQLIEALAEALGGVAAASRPLVDEGWVAASRQVGLTGTVVQPELYVAVGISGASQHMAGCSAARVIVAINNDEKAPIFRYARLGVVADAAGFLPALIDALKGR